MQEKKISSQGDVLESNCKAKVLIFSTKDSGGAGIAAYRLHRGLVDAGVDCKMIVLHKNHEDDNTVGQLQLQHNGQELDPHNSLMYAFQVAQQALAEFPNRSRTSEMFSTTATPVAFSELEDIIAESDIINLHWVAGLLDYESAGRLFAGKKVVWTLHDMNPFTGGCHYAEDCIKYQDVEGCREICPQLGQGGYDLAQQVSQIKKSFSQALDLNVVTPSRWLGSCARSSTVFEGKNVEVIPYGLSLDNFQPIPKDEARKKLNLPDDKKVVLFGCEVIQNRRKGFDLMLEAIKKLPEYIDASQEIVLAVFGAGNISVDIPYEVVNLGSIKGEDNLAAVYSAADVFVISTREDNLPNTVLESMACGTPVVGFKIGGIPDMVEEGVTGSLATPFNCAELAECIARVLVEDTDKISASCRARVEGLYALPQQASRYIEFFNELVSGGRVEVEAVERENVKDSGVSGSLSASCPLCTCGNTRLVSSFAAEKLIGLYKQRFNIDVRKYLTNSTIDLLDCPECGLRYFDPIDCGDGEFYSQLESFDWYYADEKDEYRYAGKFIDSNNDKVLDVGCGEGMFQKFASIENYTGLELNELAVNKARTAGRNVIKQLLHEHVVESSEKYDAICCFQVLEHVSDPNKFIAEALKLLKTDGVLIVSVPSNDSFVGTFNDNVLNCVPHHVLLWGKRSLSSLTEIFPLEVVEFYEEELQPCHYDWYTNEMRNSWLRSHLGLSDELFAADFAGVDVAKELSQKSPQLNPAIAQFILGNEFPAVMKEFLSHIPKQALPKGHTITAVFRKTDKISLKNKVKSIKKSDCKDSGVNSDLKQQYRKVGLGEEEIVELDRLIDSLKEKLCLNNLWRLFDQVWDELGCDDENPTSEQLTAFYNHPFWVINGLLTEIDEESLRHRKSLCEWLNMYSGNNPLKSILDYGGGWGTFARMLAGGNSSLEVKVYEPYPNPAALAESAAFENLKYVDKFSPPYDCLVAMDVLEHSCDMLESLEEMISLTKLGGLLCFGNCFMPVVKCHLPRNMHFNATFDNFATEMGLKKLGTVAYFGIFQKVSDQAIDEKRWGQLREMEKESAAIFAERQNAIAQPQKQTPTYTGNESITELSVKLNEDVNDGTALSLLRKARAALAQTILATPDEQVTALLSTDFGNRVNELLASAIYSFELLAEEEENIKQSLSLLNESEDISTREKLFSILMLYTLCHKVEVDFEKLPIDGGLSDYVMRFLFRQPTMFLESGEADVYAKHMERATAFLVEMIKRSPDSAAVISMATYFLQYENFISVYFNSFNLKDVYSNRAEILAFALRKNGFAVDWTPPKRDKQRQKLRVGFLNAHFGAQTETYVNIGFFEYLERSEFEVTLYSLKPFDSSMAEYCVSKADNAKVLPFGDLKSAAQMVRADDVDILVIGTNVTAVTNPVAILACHKLARKQLINGCCPTTTGMQYIDGFIVGKDLKDGEENYTEKLLRLNCPTFSFAHELESIDDCAHYSRADFGLSDNDKLFVSGANFYKILPELMDVWARILAEAPEAKLVLKPFGKAWSASYPENLFKQTFWDILQKHGVDSERLIFVGDLPSKNAVKELLRMCDVCLDAIPFTGANSVIDPLEVDRPIICVDGYGIRNAQGPEILRAVNLEELIAVDADAYVELAVRLIKDEAYYQEVCKKISVEINDKPIFLDRVNYASNIAAMLKELSVDIL